MTHTEPSRDGAERAHLIRVVYKSGQTVDVACDAFKVSRNKMTGELTEAQWENADPEPLWLGLDNVAAIWVLR